MSATLYKADGTEIIIGGGTVGGEDSPKTWGERNVLERAKQMSEIQYTTTAKLPCSGGDVASGATVKGLPYSYAAVKNKYIGQNVSLHTFMDAIHNPNSILYTTPITPPAGGSPARTYYGVVCSTFTAYCFGLKNSLRCRMILQSEDYIHKDLLALELCDQLVSTSHTLLVTKIVRDVYGRITNVETTEVWPPRVRTVQYTWAQFKNFVASNNYEILRYKHIDTVDYTPSKYIPLMDEAHTTINYSDISNNMGDKAVINSGDDITINPLVTEGYTAIHLFKDGTQIGTYSVEDITLTAPAAGKYVAKLYPYKDNAETSFTVVGCTYRFENNRIYYSGWNDATPVYIQACENVSESIEGIIPLSAAINQRGYAEVPEAYSSYNTFKLFLENDDGSVGFKVMRV